MTQIALINADLPVPGKLLGHPRPSGHSFGERADLIPHREAVVHIAQLIWHEARQRTIFNLKIYESRSNQEIADMLNVSVNTVKVHYARTMKHLCQRLKKN